jgi:tRNA A-37 threonylcarbamoyl transferase component Bud32
MNNPPDLAASGLELHELVGAGTSAEVYRATQLSLDKTVAVKIFRATLDDEAADLTFRRELAAVSILAGHPNITGAIGAGVTDERHPFLIMEYMPGNLLDTPPTVGHHLARPLQIGAKIAGALAAAHSAGFVHCDVKPGNVLISVYGEPMLSDFGSSAVPDVDATTRPHITLGYVAPELLTDGTGLPESDVYSWAASLVELVTGTPPYPRRAGESASDYANRVRTDRSPVTDLVRNDLLGAEFGQLLADALSYDPADRPSAKSFADGINACERAHGLPETPFAAAVAEHSSGGGDPVPGTSTAPPPATGETDRRGRKPLVLAAAALVLAVVAAGTIWALRGDPKPGTNAAATVTTTTIRVRSGASDEQRVEGVDTTGVLQQRTAVFESKLNAPVNAAFFAPFSAKFPVEPATLQISGRLPVTITYGAYNQNRNNVCGSVYGKGLHIYGIAGLRGLLTNGDVVQGFIVETATAEEANGLMLANGIDFGAEPEHCVGWQGLQAVGPPFPQRITRDDFPNTVPVDHRVSAIGKLHTDSLDLKTSYRVAMARGRWLVVGMIGRVNEDPFDPAKLTAFDAALVELFPA